VARATVTGQLNSRLTAISQQILNRSRLEGLITEFNLYEAIRRDGTMQDAVEKMPGDIIGPTVTAGSRGSSGRQPPSASFVVGFASDNPRIAMRVAERLASMFIEENLRQRAGRVEMTDQFLESQLENARAQLEQHEKRLEDFRRRHASTLPTQLGANTSGLQSAQQQISNLVDKTVQDRERRLMLERQIADLTGLEIMEASTPVSIRRGPTPVAAGSARNNQGSSRSTPGSTGGRQSAGSQPGAESILQLGNAAGISAAERLEQARKALTAMELRLKVDHPDIGIARRQIAELERLAEQEALQAPLSGGGAPTAGLSAGEIKQQQQLKALREELDMLDRQIARKEADEKTLREKASVYQARIEETPTRETELAALSRDTATLEGQYGSLLKKQADSKISSELEHRQVAEQFSIVEPPREPNRPSSPDRPRLMLMGSMSGLGLGLLLLGVLEYRDSSFRNDQDVVGALSLPVLAMIPAMTTTEDRRRKFRKRLVLAGSTAAVMVASLAAWKLQVFSRWLP
jgi:uncharacterized protein involved in exopolysaccharide biosynthesis